MSSKEGIFKKFLRTTLNRSSPAHAKQGIITIVDDVFVDILCLCDISTVISVSQVRIGFH